MTIPPPFRSRIGSKSDREFLLDPPERPVDLIGPGLLWRGSKMLVSAPYKAGKSTLCNQICFGLVGTHTLFEPLQSDGTHSVLYVQLEMHEFIVYERRMAAGVEPSDKLWVASPRNLKIDGDGYNNLRQEIAGLRPDVVILDPLYKLHNRDENDAGDMQIVFDRLDELVYDFNIGLILIHHQRKAFNGPGGDLSSPVERARGTSKMEDWPDTLVAIDADRTRDLRHLHFVCRRNPDMETITLHYDRQTNLYVVGTGNNNEVNAWAEASCPLPRTEFIQLLAVGFGLTDNEAASHLRRMQRNGLVRTERIKGSNHNEVMIVWGKEDK